VFVFQAEDGIRDRNVTGVQTCALPILSGFVLIYFIISITVFYINRKSIATEMVNYAMDFSQVQKQLVKEMSLPYAILDIDGSLRSEERRVGKECKVGRGGIADKERARE